MEVHKSKHDFFGTKYWLSTRNFMCAYNFTLGLDNSRQPSGLVTLNLKITIELDDDSVGTTAARERVAQLSGPASLWRIRGRYRDSDTNEGLDQSRGG